MFRNLSVLYCLALLASCNFQKSTNTQESAQEQEISSDSIKVFLREKNFDIVANAQVVITYEIKKTLIDGTTDEYSNKVVLKDTLTLQKSEILLSFLKNDASYDWTEEGPFTDFNPARQFLVRNESQRIILLIDANADKMGFINLEGQKVVKLSTDFSRLLSTL